MKLYKYNGKYSNHYKFYLYAKPTKPKDLLAGKVVYIEIKGPFFGWKINEYREDWIEHCFNEININKLDAKAKMEILKNL